MIQELSRRLTPRLPLVVREATFEDPALTLTGDDWAFNTVSSWRVTGGGILLFGWSDPVAVDRIWDLCGRSIVSVAAQSSHMRGDPAFEFSTGEWLEIFSDHPVDPWVFRLPEISIVGSPSDARYAQ